MTPCVTVNIPLHEYYLFVSGVSFVQTDYEVKHVQKVSVRDRKPRDHSNSLINRRVELL